MDDDLTCEELWIRLPVFQHLKVYTRTMLEQNWSRLNEADSSLLNFLESHQGDFARR